MDKVYFGVLKCDDITVFEVTAGVLNINRFIENNELFHAFDVKRWTCFQ